MSHPNPMTDTKKDTIWYMWEKGYPMSIIAKEINKPPATVFSYLEYHGGIRPRKRKRPIRALAINEREEISRGLAEGISMREISRGLGRSPSTICREVNRNRGVDRYRAIEADKAAWRRAKRPKPPVLLRNRKLKRIVEAKLSLDWSPEQISGWLKIKYSEDNSMQISHETVYRSLFIQTRGILKEELLKHLRTKRKFRHSKHHKAGSRGRIVDCITISERPAEIEDRATPGHWEGDLIRGQLNSHIATLVERTTRFTVLVKVNGKDTDTVVSALSKHMVKLPELLKQSLTWDRGTELASHQKFTMATDMDVYFCDPSSPWQRGTNENTNGLLRQYFPKKSLLTIHSQRDLNRVAAKLNNRPRKTLGFISPADKINELLR